MQAVLARIGDMAREFSRSPEALQQILHVLLQRTVTMSTGAAFFAETRSMLAIPGVPETTESFQQAERTLAAARKLADVLRNRIRELRQQRVARDAFERLAEGGRAQ